MFKNKIFTRLQARKCTDKHTAVIYIKVSWNKEYFLVSTGVKCQLKEFSAKLQKLSDKSLDTVVQDKLLDVLKVINAFTLLNKDFSLTDIQNKIINKNVTPSSFMNLATQFLEYKKSRIKESSYKYYESLVVNMLKITRLANLKPDEISLKELEFNIDLLRKHYRNKTLKIVLWLLYSMCQRALKIGIIKTNPLINLNKDDLQSFVKNIPRKLPVAKDIEQHCASSPENELHAEAARFQLRTALSFIDMKLLNDEKIVEHKGQRYILAQRKKTGVQFLIPIDNQTYELFKQHQFGQLEYRKYLKYLSLNFGVTTHSLRHLRARMMLNNGLSLEVVSRILGHSNTQTTLTYAPIQGRELSNNEISLILGISKND